MPVLDCKLLYEVSMKSEKNKEAFLALVRAGLWEQKVELRNYGAIDFTEIFQLAEKQSVLGLVAAGIEHVSDTRPASRDVLQFVGKVMQIEQQNLSMSAFTVQVVEKMYKAGLNPLLVKGQGVAQCYERPLWRSVGDIDFLFSKKEFQKAKNFFTTNPLANVVQNALYTKSFGVIIKKWFIEVHGTFRDGLSTRLDYEIDRVQEDTFTNKRVRVWQNGETEILLPDIDSDIFFVFVHFVRHFYKGGMSLRQICDWCRLLWTYCGKIDLQLLESRIKRAGLLNEWKAFSTLAVNHLKMPLESIPLYDDDVKWERKAKDILACVLINGGLEKDVKKAFHLFPVSTIRFLPSLLFNVNWLKIKERLLFEA